MTSRGRWWRSASSSSMPTTIASFTRGDLPSRPDAPHVYESGLRSRPRTHLGAEARERWRAGRFSLHFAAELNRGHHDSASVRRLLGRSHTYMCFSTHRSLRHASYSCDADEAPSFGHKTAVRGQTPADEANSPENKKSALCRRFTDGETRTRTGDTTIFSHLEQCWSYVAICSADLALLRAPATAEIPTDTGRIPGGFGHEMAVRGRNPGGPCNA
jgi:hypothetical protein